MSKKFDIVCWYLVVTLLFVASCKDRKILYSDFNNLVFGSQSFILYDDKTFYLEMGAGGVEGNYQIAGDIVKFEYHNKPGSNWPDVMLIRNSYFISLDSVVTGKYLKIE